MQPSAVIALAPRFDYEVTGANTVKIGGLTSDLSMLKMQLARSRSRKTARVQVSYPTALFPGATQVLLRDHQNLAIANYSIPTLEAGKAVPEVRTVERLPVTEQTLSQLFLLPHFRLCIQSETLSTQTFVCSRSYYFDQQQRLRVRGSTSSEGNQNAIIEINGQSGGRAGSLFLQDEASDVSFRFVTREGASLELYTQARSIEILDAVAGTDPSTLRLRGRGAEPLSAIESRDSVSWWVNVPMDRPSLLVRGLNQVPLVQEFALQGGVRPADLQVQFSETPPQVVYSSSETLRLKTSPDITLAPVGKNTSLRKTGPSTWDWTWQNLPTDQVETRSLQVRRGSSVFIAAWELERRRRNALTLRLHSPPTWISARWEMKWIPHFSLAAQYDQFASKLRSQDPNLGFATLESVTHTADQNYGLILGARLWSLDSRSSTSAVAGIRLQAVHSKGALEWGWLRYWQATRLEFRMPVWSASGTLTTNSGVDTELASVWNQSNVHEWKFGIRQISQRFTASDNSTFSIGSPASFFLGLRWFY